MDSWARSLSFSAVLLVVAMVCLFVAAEPAPKDSAQQPRAPLPDVAPISLSDPDGQELILEDLSARTAIEGMLSLTELEFRFRNPKAARIEGRFTCTLPPNAAISRFAKEVNGQLMEGEVVERLRANQVYEQFLHQMRDPALLEQDQGNRFSARIFPIEANATVRILLSYTALLPIRGGARTYTLPLRGLAKVDHFAFRAFVTPLPGEQAVGVKGESGIGGLTRATRSTADVISLEETDYTPTADIVLSWQTTEAVPSRVVRAGDFYLAAFRPQVRVQNGSDPTRSWTLYIDTSASAAEGAEHRIRALETLLGSMPAGEHVEVIAFDQDIVPLGNGSAAEMSRRIGSLLRSRLFLGGTDLGALLRDVKRAATDGPGRTIVVASDLVATLGSTDSKSVADAIRTLPSATIHAVVLGSRQDAPTARALTSGRGRVITIPFSETIDDQARQAAADLRKPLGATIDVADAGAEWMYPTRFTDVQDGDEVIVLGRLRAGAEPAARMSGAGSLQTATSTTLPAGTFAPLLEREAYRAYLEYLAEREANEPSEAVRRALASEQVKISVEQRVVIPRTTMLVLESEWDYQRFGLDRRALAAILSIEAGGIGRIDRARISTPPPLPPRPMPVPRKEGRRRERSAAPQMPSTATQSEVIGAVEDGVANIEEDDVAGGVAGSVAGSVAGDMAGGVAFDAVGEVAGNAPPPPPAPVAPPPPSVSESLSAPRTRPSPPPPSPRPRPEEPKSDSSWARKDGVKREELADLEKRLRDNPRDRELYNQIGERLVALRQWNDLRSLALRWQPYDPENPQVYELLGSAGEKSGRETEAARAYASLIELAPAKTELLQRAGLLLVRVKKATLAEAPLRKALEVRPDRANGYRHLALMLWLDGRVEEAARVLESATRQTFPGWYGDVQRVIREELGYVYRAWIARAPERRAEIEQRARDFNVDLSRRDALRVTLVWETDANDVDLHVVDPNEEEAFYSHPETRSGLQLYGDITQGLGPEVIRTSKVERGAYHIGVRYFAAGPMGVSRGLVVVMRDQGGQPSVEIHPFRLVEGGEAIRYVARVEVK